MARVSIYVSDELKARMDVVGEAINWSEVARLAFHAAIALQENRKGKSMSTVVERLRASREQYIANEKRYGHEAGRKWAEDKASYLDLTRIALISDPPSADGWALTALYKVVDPDEQLDGEDVARYLNLHPNDITDEFAAAFIEGAKEVYNEVKDQI